MENKKPKDPQRKKLFRQVLIAAGASTLIATGASLGITFAIASKQLKLPSYIVTFKNWDGTILQTSKVQIGGDAKYTGAQPTKPTENYVDFKFKGWDRELTNIIADREITAEFDSIYQTYTMTWYSDEEGTKVCDVKDDCHKQDIAAKQEAVTKIIPTKTSTSSQDFIFSRWEYYGDWENEGVRFAKPVFDSKQTGLAITNGEVTSYSGTADTLEIPKTWNGQAVTTIGSNIFNSSQNASSVRKIIIHDNITTIKPSAFVGATNLETVQFDSNCQITEIPAYTFQDCENLKSFVFPDSITTIGNRAFQNCVGITKITLGVNTVNIDDNAFTGCTSLADIEVKSGNPRFITDSNVPGVLFGFEKDVGHILIKCMPAVTSLDTTKLPSDLFIITSSAFQGSSITSLDFSPCQNLKRIDDYAFAGSKIVTFNTGNTVLNLGKNIFQDCTSLSTITLGTNVQAEGILSSTLSGCNSITTINVDTNNPELWSSNGILYRKNTNNTLLRCPSAKPSITIDTNCKEIGDNALENCDAVVGTTDTPYVIPDHITIIGKEAFKGCNNLECVRLGDGNIESFGDDVFKSCNNLVQITIGSAQKFEFNMNTKVFAGCSNLLQIEVDENNENFEAVDGVLYGLKSGIKCLVKYPAGKSLNPDFVIPDGTTYIAKSSFDGSHNLTSITLPSSIIGIFGGAFNDCTSLSTIYVKPGFNIPTTSESFHTDIFTGCTALNKVVLKQIDGNQGTILSGIYRRLPSQAADKTLTLELDIESGSETIEKSAFAGNTCFTDLIIKNGVTQIGSYAFNGCSNLKTAVLSDGLTTINDHAFLGCTNLKTITIPSTLTTIGEGAFGDCRALISLDWGSTGITSIESSTFGSAKNLSSIILPSSLTYLGGSAFGSCDKLSYVEFKGTIKQFKDATNQLPWKPFPDSTLLTKIVCSDGDIDLYH